ncbi:MAG: hypothetical protein Q7R83_02995 [bacterium]|nr:hypothetical protein [bacterium]
MDKVDKVAILWNQDQIPSGSRELGEVEGYGETRAGQSVEVAAAERDATNMAYADAQEQAARMGGKCIFVREVQMGGFMAPTCRVHAVVYA